MSHDVFISYSQKDRHTAMAVCHTLEARGVRCWIAPRDIDAGKEWMPAIAEGLSGSKALVLVFSSRANGSRHVAREVSIAFNEEIPIIPFRVEDVPPSTALKYAIGTTHWLDALTPPLEQHLETLADTVASLVGPRGDDEVPRAAPSEPRSRFAVTPARLPVWAAASAAVAVIAIVLVVALQLSDPPAPSAPLESTEQAPVAPPFGGPSEPSPLRTDPPAVRTDPPPVRTEPPAAGTAPPATSRPAGQPGAAPAEDSPEGIMAGYRRSLAASLTNAISCTRVTMQERASDSREPVEAADGVQGLAARSRARSLAIQEASFQKLQESADQRLLLSHGLGFVSSQKEGPEYPFIVCHAGRAIPQWSLTNWPHWTAAREVRLGTSPGALTLEAPVSLTLEQVQAQELAARLGTQPAFDQRQPFWHAFLPAIATEVYARVVFEDGSTSDEVQVRRIEQLNLGRR